VADLAEDLKRVPLFAELGTRQLRKLAGLCRERTISAGTTPVREGTMSGIGFFVVAEGEAAVSVDGDVVATLKPGDYFGELALITEGERTATVTATTDLRALVIAFYDFREFAMANPDVTWKLLQHVVTLLQPANRTPGASS
jgi:CRP-like cAMP-binding protein